MSARTATERTTPRTGPIERVRWAIHDGLVLTRRNLLRYVRIPTLLVFSTVQPVMFVLLFRYVFGGSIGNLPPGARPGRTRSAASRSATRTCGPSASPSAAW